MLSVRKRKIGSASSECVWEGAQEHVKLERECTNAKIGDHRSMTTQTGMTKSLWNVETFSITMQVIGKGLLLIRFFFHHFRNPLKFFFELCKSSAAKNLDNKALWLQGLKI